MNPAPARPRCRSRSSGSVSRHPAVDSIERFRIDESPRRICLNARAHHGATRSPTDQVPHPSRERARYQPSCNMTARSGSGVSRYKRTHVPGAPSATAAPSPNPYRHTPSARSLAATAPLKSITSSASFVTRSRIATPSSARRASTTARCHATGSPAGSATATRTAGSCNIGTVE